MKFQSEFEQYVAICKRIYERLVESGQWRDFIEEPKSLPA